MSDFKAFVGRMALLAVAIITLPLVFVILWFDGYFKKDRSWVDGYYERGE